MFEEYQKLPLMWTKTSDNLIWYMGEKASCSLENSDIV